jgi:hypothetical protein
MKNDNLIRPKPIRVVIGDTDLQLMKDFVELTDKMGLYDWEKKDDKNPNEQNILCGMRKFCNEVSWFNRRMNPYKMEVK